MYTIARIEKVAGALSVFKMYMSVLDYKFC